MILFKTSALGKHQGQVLVTVCVVSQGSQGVWLQQTIVMCVLVIWTGHSDKVCILVIWTGHSDKIWTGHSDKMCILVIWTGHSDEIWTGHGDMMCIVMISTGRSDKMCVLVIWTGRSDKMCVLVIWTGCSDKMCVLVIWTGHRWLLWEDKWQPTEWSSLHGSVQGEGRRCSLFLALCLCLSPCAKFHLQTAHTYISGFLECFCAVSEWSSCDKVNLDHHLHVLHV